MTNHWADIANADVILSMGGNSAEAHPVGFRSAMRAKERSNAIVISIDPRFNRTPAVADHPAWLRPGTDIVVLGALISDLIENDRYAQHSGPDATEAPAIVAEGFGFEEGVFTGYDPTSKTYDRQTWNFELDENGFARSDPSLQHPRCVFQLMRQHYSRYTLEQ